MLARSVREGISIGYGHEEVESTFGSVVEDAIGPGIGARSWSG